MRKTEMRLAMITVVTIMVLLGTRSYIVNKQKDDAMEHIKSSYAELLKEREIEEAKARELSQFTKHEIELAMDLQADEDEKGTGTVVYLKKVNGHTHIGWDYTGETERLFSE